MRFWMLKSKEAGKTIISSLKEMAIHPLNIFLFNHILVHNYASALFQLSLWVFPSIIEILVVQIQHLKCIHLFLYRLELKNLLYAQNKFIIGAMRKMASHVRA